MGEIASERMFWGSDMLRRLSERAPDGALEFRRGLSEPRADDSAAFTLS